MTEPPVEVPRATQRALLTMTRALVRGISLDPAIAEITAASCWDHLAPAMVLHGLVVPAQRALAHHPQVPPGVLDELAAQARNDVIVAMRVEASLRGVATALGDLRYAVLKGPVLAQLAYQDPAARSYGDLDLLVAPDDFLEALSRLFAAGGRPEGAIPTPGPAADGETAMTDAKGISLDVHWHVVNKPFARKHFSVDTEFMLDRLRLVDIGGVSVPTLDPVDTLLHTALHASLSGARKLQWMRDIAGLCARDGGTGAVLEQRLGETRTALPVLAAIERAHQVIGHPCPTPRARGAWAAWLRATTLTRDPVGAYGRPGNAQSFWLATRSSTATSLRSWLGPGRHG